MKYSDLYKECRLCPRNCRVDRTDGNQGYCSQSAELYIARASLHAWEEPCISGERGSGTVFFSGCPLHCVYCQNDAISGAKAGKKVTVDRLCEIFYELREKGAHNINLVTPTHFLAHIAEAIERVKSQGFSLPFVYNTSGYEKQESLRMLSGLIDIYLPDFKYTDPQLAKDYSHAENYVDVAKAAIAEMVRQQPRAVFDDDEMMTRGVIVRHLMLPHSYKNSKNAIEYLYNTYGDSIYVSIMSQYTPIKKTEEVPCLNDRVTQREYDRLVDYAIGLGVEKAFIQDGESATDSFIPQFDCEGV